MRSLLLVLLAAKLSTSAFGADIKIHVIDGKSGKPVANEHLLVFEGDSVEAVKRHQHHVDLYTDSGGIAALPNDDMHWLQVWVEWHRSCQSEPETAIYSVTTLRQSGLVSSNTCGSFSQSVRPNELYLFVRRETLIEKMRH
jgi:hypothetical protein